MKPIRRKKKYEVVQNPITEQERVLNMIEEENILSDQGSVDSVAISRKYFLDCGCNGSAGGYCNECGAYSCTSCHGLCHRCNKSICLEHSQFFQIEGEDRVRFCGNCYGIVTRKRITKCIGKGLVSLGRLLSSTFIERVNDE